MLNVMMVLEEGILILYSVFCIEEGVLILYSVLRKACRCCIAEVFHHMELCVSCSYICTDPDIYHQVRIELGRICQFSRLPAESSFHTSPSQCASSVSLLA